MTQNYPFYRTDSVTKFIRGKGNVVDSSCLVSSQRCWHPGIVVNVFFSHFRAGDFSLDTCGYELPYCRSLYSNALMKLLDCEGRNEFTIS